LAQRPEIILADEPVASLDPRISGEILGLLQSVSRADGVAVLCSLHQVHFATAYAGRIVGLAHGRLVLDVPVGEFDPAAIERIYERRRDEADDLDLAGAESTHSRGLDPKLGLTTP